MSDDGSAHVGRPPSARLRRIFVGAAVIAVLAGSCSGDEAPAEGARAVTDAEANRLAETLFRNHDLGGARFSVDALVPGGSTLHLEGEIDWTTHTGHAVVTGTGSEAATTEVYWSDTSVLERRPALLELASRSGADSFEFVARDPDPTGRHLDSLLGILTGLGSTRRDNPQLIRQSGAEHLREDALRGTDVSVMRFGNRTIYWVDAGGTMLRLEGNNEASTRPFIIDLFEHGATTVEPPQRGDVVAIETVTELYDATS